MLYAKDILLRDFIESDIEKRIYWEKVETEWQLWDGPWEYDGLTEEEKEKEFSKYLHTMNNWVKHYQHISDDEKRHTFQIATRDDGHNYIGWVSYYRIDDDANITNDNGHCAVGINIPDLSARGKGYAYQALCIFINYLLKNGEADIYTQTWSGNLRMIHIAEKMGFEECRRKTGVRFVRGKAYDGLTFKLNKDKYNEFCADFSGIL